MGGGKFSDGFLVGAVAGAAAFFLLGTEKGKKILKAITEEGGEELGRFLNEFEKQNSGAKPTPKSDKNQGNENVENIENEQVPQPNGVKEEKSHKRFFKKSK